MSSSQVQKELSKKFFPGLFKHFMELQELCKLWIDFRFFYRSRVKKTLENSFHYFLELPSQLEELEELAQFFF